MDRERQATTERNQRRSFRGPSLCVQMIGRKALEPQVSRTSASDSPKSLRGAHGEQASVEPEIGGETTGALAPSRIDHAREPLLRRCVRLVLYMHAMPWIHYRAPVARKLWMPLLPTIA